MSALAERVREALAAAVDRVEVGGGHETVNVMPVVAGESIGHAMLALDEGARAATQGRRVRATMRAHPGSGGCALVLLERLEDVEVLRAKLHAAYDTLIERWSASGSALPAHEWMGLTREEYAAWVELRGVFAKGDAR